MVDITPPLGIELAGFHGKDGQVRVIEGIRQAPAARALVLRCGPSLAVIVSLEVCAVSRGFAARVRGHIADRFGIPAAHVRICATHTHSMPTLRSFLQWGGVSKDYQATVEKDVFEAVARAKDDLAPADLYVGKDRVVGGNFNRTTKTWKTDAEFTKDSTDADRWLDTTLHAMYFLRAKPKRELVWYHFSAHPVCYGDKQAGPDWPGLVHDQIKSQRDLMPAYLQGHCGDVNPGDGKKWIGDPNQVEQAVSPVLNHVINHAEPVRVEDIRVAGADVRIPLDIALFKDQLARYRKDPAKCNRGEWVDAGFAKAWADNASKWDTTKDTLDIKITSLRLGDTALLFHPAELYSYYGLEIRRDSPFAHTMVVGYTDDMIGYLTDPAAYRTGEYAAVVVPKILELPPFKPEAAHVLADAAKKLLTRIAG